MRTFFFFAVLLLVGYATARTQPESIQKCEDVLSQSICDKLRKAAAALEQEIEVVDNIIREVVKSGLKRADEIIHKVEERLVEMAKNVHCDHILPAKICKKLYDAAEKLKLKVEDVEHYLKTIIAKGLTKVEEIVKEIIKRFFPTELIGISKCEDVLSAQICEQLREAAKKLKIQAEIIDKFIKEAVAKGITKTKEIIAEVQKKIAEIAINFKCTDALPEHICAKLAKLAATLEVKFAEVEKVMKEAIAKGIKKAQEIIHEIIDRFFPHVTLEEVTGISKCEDVLSAEACAKLREVAKKLKVEIAVIDKMVREAVVKGITKAKEIIAKVEKKVIAFAINFKCEDALRKDVCDKLREAAKKLKVEIAVIDKIVREVVAKGITKAKEIIAKVEKKIIDLATNFKCEDALSKDVCDELREAAKKLKIEIAVIDKVVRETVAKGINKAKEIIAVVRKRIVDFATHFKCTDALSEEMCTKIMDIAEKLKIKFAEVEKVMKEVIAKGIKNAKEIIHAIIDHFFPHVTLEEVTGISKCEDVLSAEVCDKLREAAKKLKVEIAVVDKIVREVVAKGITKAKEIIAEVEKKIIDFATNFKCEDALSKHVCDELREAAKKLKIEIAVIDKVVRETVAKGINKAKEIMAVVRKRIVDFATHFKCTDALSEEMCTKIMDIAAKLKVKIGEVEKVMKVAIAKGIKKATEIIHAIIDHFFPHLTLEDVTGISKCEDVLSTKACAKLRELAKKLKVEISVIDKMVREAVAKGITKAKKIIAEVEKKIIDFATHFTCEDALRKDVCDKLREAAKKLKVEIAVIDKIVREVVAKGITKAEEIIVEVEKKIIDFATNFKCEDALSKDVCDQLREAAKKLKIEIAVIDKVVREAVAKGITKAKEIIAVVRKRIVDFATHFKCTDALSEEMCTKIMNIAAKLKVKVAEVEKIMKAVIARGIKKAEEIILAIIDHFFPHLTLEDVTGISKCEDVLPAKACAKLRDLAQKLKVEIAVIDKMVREAVAKGITKAKKIIAEVEKKVIDFATHFKCEDALRKDVCDKLREAAKKLKVKIAVIDKIVREAVAKGITKAKQIIAEVEKKIVDYATNFKCENVLSKDVCEQLREAAKKLKVEVAVIDKMIREVVAKGITKAKQIIAEVRKRIVDFATHFKCTDALSEKTCAKIMEIADKLKVKFAEVEKIIKVAIAKGIKKAKEIIHAIIDHFFPHPPVSELVNIEVKKCEDLLSEKICNEFRAIAKRMKVKVDEVDRIIREVADKKITKVSQIVAYYRKRIVELATKFGCNDIIPRAICDKIKELAEQFKVKSDQVEKYIREIVAKGVTSVHDILHQIIDRFFPDTQLTDVMVAVKCEDVLPATACKQLREIAAKLKIKAAEIDQIIREAVARHITDAKKLIKYIREKLVELAKNFQCTDVLSEDVCAELKYLAKKFEITAKQVDKYIKEIVAKGVKKISEIIHQIIEHFFPHAEPNDLRFLSQELRFMH